MTAFERAGEARLLRPSDGWRPVGPVMPPLRDDGMHDHSRLAVGEINHWTLSTEIDAEPGDVLLVAERALRFLDRCGPNHWAWSRMRAYLAHAGYGPGWIDRFLAGRQIWSARVEDPVRLKAMAS